MIIFWTFYSIIYLEITDTIQKKNVCYLTLLVITLNHTIVGKNKKYCFWHYITQRKLTCHKTTQPTNQPTSVTKSSPLLISYADQDQKELEGETQWLKELRWRYLIRLVWFLSFMAHQLSWINQYQSHPCRRTKIDVVYGLVVGYLIPNSVFTYILDIWFISTSCRDTQLNDQTVLFLTILHKSAKLTGSMYH